MGNASRSNRDARDELTGSSPVRPTKVKVTLHLTEEAAATLARLTTERGRGQLVSRLIMATMESDSMQSAKLPKAGSTPAVASCILVMPAWWWEVARDTWLSLQASGEMVNASALKADEPEGS